MDTSSVSCRSCTNGLYCVCILVAMPIMGVFDCWLAGVSVTLPLVAEIVMYSLNRPETPFSINIVAAWIRTVKRNRKQVVCESNGSTCIGPVILSGNMDQA